MGELPTAKYIPANPIPVPGIIFIILEVKLLTHSLTIVLGVVD